MSKEYRLLSDESSERLSLDDNPERSSLHRRRKDWRLEYGLFAILQLLLLIIYTGVFLLMKEDRNCAQSLVYCESLLISRWS